MTTLLLIGHSPPPLLRATKVEAAHYRTWQFLQPLLDDGHAVTLCALAPSDTAIAPEGLAHLGPRLRVVPLDLGVRGWPTQMQRLHDEVAPACIVAVNFDAALAATKLQSDRPRWMDIYGDYLTIVQAACYRANSDRGMATSIGFVRQVLQAGDIFSVCGTPQAHALVGQLAMAGRLNQRSFGYDFTRVVLPGAPPAATLTAPAGAAAALRAAHGIGAGAFVVLWCGGYNTWTDVDALFAALDWAMALDPALHYLSIGANSYSAPDNVYARLLAMVERSPHRDRYHLLGWRPWGEVAAAYAAADVGLNIDARHYETRYGTRTRLVEMMAAGLPVITSLGSELSEMIARRAVGLTFEIGDWRALGGQMLALAQDRPRCRALAAAARDYAHGDLSFATTTAPLRAWAHDPHPAPDRAPEAWRARLRRIEYGARAHLRQLAWRLAAAQ